MGHVFQTTSQRGLNHNLPPMRLWHKAKKLGTWDPRAISLDRDIKDWRALSPDQRDLIVRLTSLFQAGEEAVTLDLLPLIMVVAEEGRLEEEMFLTAFLWEEAKHVEAFRRFLDEVVCTHEDLSHYHTPNYSRIFYRELPAALNRLRHDSSPQAQAEASVTYNLIVEGVLAETGYHAYHAILKRNDLLPGMLQMMEYLKRDESRHLAYGVYLLSRLVIEHGDPIWNAIERRMGELLTPAIEVVNELFEAYPVLPFDLQVDEFIAFAMAQFQARSSRIEKARGQTLEQLNRVDELEQMPV